MASTLAAQLQQLAAAQNPGAAAKPKFRGKPSLLFDFQKAADVDVQTIYEIACQGLDELIRKDPKFRQFKESLFSRASLALNPDQQTPEVLTKLDDAIQAFCSLLCDHFMSPACFKVLEFLIRRFKANERNVDALFLCALPYHATNEFVRVVQTLSISKGLWSWMAKMQETGASMPRDLLVKRCINDKAVLHFICQSARYQGTKRTPSKTFLSFYAVVLCEVATGLPSISEEVLSQLLAYLVDGLGVEASADYRSSTLMIVANLCSRAKLGHDFLKVVCSNMLKHNDAQTAGQSRTTLLMLAHIAATQPQLMSLAEKSTKYLMAIPNLVGELASLSHKGIRLAPLMALIARSLAALMPTNVPKYSQHLLDLAHAGVLAPAARELAGRLMAAATAGSGAGAHAELADGCSKVLRALDLRYPSETDAAVNAALAPLAKKTAACGDKKKAKAAAGGASSDDEDDSDVEVAPAGLSAEQTRLFEFIKATFVHTASAPCGGSMLTLSMALTAPAAGVRRMALQQLDAQLADRAQADADEDDDTAAATASDDARAYLRTAALARLQDDDLEVVVAALGLRCLDAVPPAALADALQPLLSRLSGLLFSQGKHDGLKAARSAAARLLPLLARLTGVTQGAVRDSLVLHLLEFMLPTKHDRKLAVKAAEAAASGACQGHVLLGACSLGAVKQAAEAASEDGGKKSSKKSSSKGKKGADKEDKKGGDKKADKAAAALAVQQAIVDAMGKAIASGPAVLAEACRLADAARAQLTQQQPMLRARHLLMLALTTALGASPAAAATPSKSAKAASASNSPAAVAHAAVRAAVSELSAVAPSVAESDLEAWKDTFSSAFGSDGRTTTAHLSATVRQLPATHAAFVCHSLQQALRALPEPKEASEEQLQAAAASFASLAVLKPREVFAPQLQLLVGHLVPAAACAPFLARLYGAPSGTTLPAVQAAALHALASIVTAASVIASSGKASKGSSPSSADAVLVVSLLPALRSPSSVVRKAAMQCLATIQPALEPGHALAAYAAALLEHKKFITADADACMVVTRNTLCNTNARTAASAAATAAQDTPAKQKKKGAADAAAHDAPGLKLSLAPAAAAGVVQSLASALSHIEPTPHGCNTATAVLECLLPEPHELAAGAASHEQAVMPAGAKLLKQLLAWWRASPAAALPMHAQLVGQLVALFTPATAASLDLATLGLLISALQLAPAVPLSAVDQVADAVALQKLAVQVRLAAGKQAASPALYAGLKSKDLRLVLVVALMRAAEGDADEAVRAAARGALEGLPLSSSLLVPILQGVVFAPAVPAGADKEAHKHKKGKKDEAAEAAAPAPAPAPLPHAGSLPAMAPLQLAVLALELLQWKDGIKEPAALVPACQALLLQLLPVLDTIASAYEGEGEGEGDADEDTAAADQKDQAVSEAAAPAPGGKSSLAGYAAQLVLMALQGLVGAVGTAEGLAAYDLALVVRTAREAPDAPVRNSALSLLAALAGLRPQAVLDHVLQVLALVHQTAALQDDEHSRAVAATALAAVVPAWVSSGRGTAALWHQVVDALAALPHHRRFSLVYALLQALPQEEGLCEGLAVMLAAAAKPAPAAAATAVPAEPHSAKKSKKDKKKEDEAAAAAPAPAAAAADSSVQDASEWLPELASQLALQVEMQTRMSCFATVMRRSLADAANKPHVAFPRIVVAFVTAQLKMKTTTTAYTAVYRRPDADPALEAACRRVMEQALAQVQLMQGEVPGTSAAAVSLRAATRAASDGLYALFDALQGVMQPDAYIQALLQLCGHTSDKVKSRALKLFMRRVKDVRAEIEDMVELPQRVRDAKLRQAADAATAVCGLLEALLAPGARQAASPLTRQLVLVAAGAVAAEFGSTHYEALLAALPSVVAAIKDNHTNVRSSALATVATFVQALTSRVVPLLPVTVSAVVSGADAAWAALSKGGPGSGEAAAAAGEAEDDVDEEDRLEARSAHDEAALELSSALAGLSALVEALGAFLSPHLPQVMRLLLQPQVLTCETAGCSRFAGAIRTRLPTAVPARLLLTPMFDRLQPCIDAGAQSAVALLDMVASCASSMEAKVAAQFHEQMFLFLLRALDVRQRRPASLPSQADITAVEASALRSLTALVMKLSEAKFKPLFLRLVEWASSVSVPETGSREPSYIGRMVTLFGAVNALTDRLRSVFVPYFRYLLDTAVQHLSYGDDGRPRSKKKAKKGAAADVGSEAGHEDADAGWLLRLRIIHALHRCFIHDNVGFVDQDKFAKLMGPLVDQLEAEPPAACVPMLCHFGADADLDSYLPLGKATAVYTLPSGAHAVGPSGAAAVRCLVALAVAVNSDAQWKPLNHAALMLTRASSPRVRALGLEVVAQLVERLREEYLVLLPEALPFMSELLEDTDPAVETRTQEVIKQLEEISGEKLDEYLKV